MAESLEEFLGVNKKSSSVLVNGSMRCRTCNQTVNEGTLDQDDRLLIYYCSNGHESRVSV